MSTETTDNGGFSLQGGERRLQGEKGSGLAQPLRLLEVEISAVQSHYHTLEEQIAEQESVTSKLQNDIRARDARIEQLESALAEAIAAQAPSADATVVAEGEGFHRGTQLVEPPEPRKSQQVPLAEAASNAQFAEYAPDHIEDQIDASHASGEVGVAACDEAIGDIAGALTGKQAVARALQNLDRYLLCTSPKQPASVEGSAKVADVLADLEQQLDQQRELVRIHHRERAKLDLKQVELENICIDRQERISALEQELERREAELEGWKAGSAKARAIFRERPGGNRSLCQDLASPRGRAAEGPAAVAAPEMPSDHDGIATMGLKAQSAVGSGDGHAAEEQVAKTAATAAKEPSEPNRLRARAGRWEQDLAGAMTEAGHLTGEPDKAVAQSGWSHQSGVGRDVDRQVLLTELAEQRKLVAVLEGSTVNQRQSLCALQESWRRLSHITSTDADSGLDTVKEGANQSPSWSSGAESSHRPYLLVEGARVALEQPEMTIGRSAINDICLQSVFASRVHARLMIGPAGVLIEDLGSRNGVRVNGRKVHCTWLRPGDEIRIGDCDLQFFQPVRPGQATARGE